MLVYERVRVRIRGINDEFNDANGHSTFVHAFTATCTCRHAGVQTLCVLKWTYNSTSAHQQQIQFCELEQSIRIYILTCKLSI